MDAKLTTLIRFFRLARQRADPLTLATILRTEGSTYAKAGTQILLAPSGSTSGLLSGGCLEADLAERARRLHHRLRPERVWFDTRGTEDPLFGLGLGCEGAMDVWLEPLVAPRFTPLDYLEACFEKDQPGAMAVVVAHERNVHIGRRICVGDSVSDALGMAVQTLLADVPRPALRSVVLDAARIEVFIMPVSMPPRLLICGAGPDAVPLARMAGSLGWRVTVTDHRAAYAQALLFSEATVRLGPAAQIGTALDVHRFDAAVVMSHHLPSDAEYLRALLPARIRYLGILGPAARRAKLLAAAGSGQAGQSAPLYGPAGLDIGADSPESIALAICAEIQSVLARKPGRSLSVHACVESEISGCQPAGACPPV